MDAKYPLTAGKFEEESNWELLIACFIPPVWIYLGFVYLRYYLEGDFGNGYRWADKENTRVG